MIRWIVSDYAALVGEIERGIAQFESLTAYASLNQLGHAKATGQLSDAWKTRLADTVAAFAAREAGILRLDKSVQIASQLERQLRANGRYSPELALKDLQHLKQLIVMESAEITFAFIPSANAKYFEQDKLFGEHVFDTFAQARDEIKDAGNSLAAQLPTAAVFHLMRVSEYGLRAIAKKLRVKLQDKGRSQPLEYADWQKVITGCQNAVKTARTLSADQRKQARLSLLSEAADHCEYMKDIWRNDIAHARKRYREAEALVVYEQVRSFMEFLATRVLK